MKIGDKVRLTAEARHAFQDWPRLKHFLGDLEVLAFPEMDRVVVRGEDKEQDVFLRTRFEPVPDPASVGSMSWFADTLEENFEALRALRGCGQKEYAHAEANAFGNFDRVGALLDLAPEKVLQVYLQKHMDGIAAYVNGHESQREDVLGRIHDAQLYLALLRGLVLRKRAKK